MSNSFSKSALMKIAGIGSVGMLLGLDSTTAIKVSQKAAVSTGLNAQIQTLSQSVEQALAESGELASLMADSELKQLLSEEIKSAVTEELTSTTNQKTNLEEATSVAHKQAKKHHHKHKHSKKGSHHSAPVQTSNLASSTQMQNVLIEQNSFPVNVPIDEVKAITLKVSPTFERDIVESVTLKAFRKVIGYDTFNSILKQDRDETKDTADHYNITVSMMVRRDPEVFASNGTSGEETVKLADIIDKGFPYDDGDNTISDAAQMYAMEKVPQKTTLVGKLNGENITKEALQNLVRDTEVPITQQLLQLDSDIKLTGDADNVFKLMDENVTKGQMKNLITDKPAPITVKLAQTSGDADNVFKLMDENVTKGQMKNLITDKPAPITVKLAQTSGDADNVFKLMDENVTKGQMKNLITDKPAPITVKLAQKSAADNGVHVQTQQLSEQASQLVKGKAHELMGKVNAYCECQQHHLAQMKKKPGVVYEIGDDTCEAVENVPGIDCQLDGYNVTLDALEGLLTDRDSPITLPLDPDALAQKTQMHIATVQIKSDEEDAPTEADMAKAEEEEKSAKNVAAEAFGGLADNSLKEQGIEQKKPDESTLKIKDPMHGQPLDITMSVSGSYIDLSKATHDANIAAKAKAEDDAVAKLAQEQDA